MPGIPVAQIEVQFNCANYVISINGPEGPTDPETQPKWVMDQTADLTVYSYETTDTLLSTWTLNFANLTDSDWLALRTFFYSQARGPTNTFTYKHTDKRAYAGCRFFQTQLKASRRNGRDYSVQLVLLVPGAVSALPEIDP